MRVLNGFDNLEGDTSYGALKVGQDSGARSWTHGKATANNCGKANQNFNLQLATTKRINANHSRPQGTVLIHGCPY